VGNASANGGDVAPRDRYRLLAAIAIALPLTALAGAPEVGGTESARPSDVGERPFPVGERLTYAVSWVGIRCGSMEIVSFVDRSAQDHPIYRIVVFARTSRFFDGIYRVRSRLDSFFDPVRMSSVRYEERGLEKKKRKDEIWLVDDRASEVIRTKNGETTRIPIDVERAFDPLAFIFRLRTMPLDLGQVMTLGLMTSRGVAETDARVTELKDVKTKRGRCDAASVVPEPRDKMMFSKSGAMWVWLERADPHRPCKIEFDLSFGKLVASLEEVEEIDTVDVESEWAAWIGDAKGSK
jgi:hypothetical protein